MSTTKRTLGQFFTTSKNPFELKPFQKWANGINLSEQTILEPFAGANHIIHSLKQLGFCKDYQAFDISPSNETVQKRDSLKEFPTGFNVCITNPPWLARNSAKRRGLSYSSVNYNDIYKECLNQCLKNCKFVAAIIPASSLQSKLFRDRLETYILIHSEIFGDTVNPVCLALFTDSSDTQTKVYYDDNFIGFLDALERKIPVPKSSRKLTFNDPNGKLGFISFDNHKERSIRFCEAKEVDHYKIKVSSRFITRIGGDLENALNLIPELNKKLNSFRDETQDLFLTPFKGLRSDGMYRRRMFFSQARLLINSI